MREQALAQETVLSESRIVSSYEMRSNSDDGSGSSRGYTRYVERRLSADNGAPIFEYDVEVTEAAPRHPSDWHFPVRVTLEPGSHALKLVNRTAMEARRDAWLDGAGLSADECGRSYFTWNVFKVECDPEAVLPVIADLRGEVLPLEDGAIAIDDLAAAPVPVRRETLTEGTRYTANFALDEAAARRQLADKKRIVAEISGKTMTGEEALAAAARHDFSGTITVEVLTDASGDIVGTNRTSETIEVGADRAPERTTAIRTIRRTKVSSPE